MPAERKAGSAWLPTLIAVIPITIGVIQYYSTRQNEFLEKFWEQQYAIYTEASEAAAEIAMAGSLEAAAPARDKFWKLYWGRLSMLENKEVEQAMKAFGARLGECEREKVESCFGETDGSIPVGLRSLSYQLAHCLRYSLLETWNPADIDDFSEICPHVEPE